MNSTNDSNGSNNYSSSLLASNYLLNYLVQKTFQGVAKNNVIRMLPTSTNKQNLYTLKSFVGMAHTSNNTQLSIQSQQDPKSSPLDNFSVNQISIDQANTVTILKDKNEQKSLKTQKSGRSGRSGRSRKFTNLIEQNQKQVSKSKLINNLEQLPQQIKQQVFDPDEQKLRVNYINYQKEEIYQKQYLRKNQTEREQKKKINQKIMKDIKKFTYDYEGKLHGQGSGANQMEKLLFLKQKFVDLKTVRPNNHTIKNQTIQIQKTKKNERTKERLNSQPFFSDQPKSIVSYLNQNSIAQGVKITQTGKNNQNITKQNSNKPTGLRSYKIGQYKSLSQNLKFKEHPRSGSLYQTESQSILDTSLNSHDIGNKIVSKVQAIKRKLNSKSHFSHNEEQKIQTLDMERSRKSINTNSQSQFKAKVKYSGLPFIKTKGYRAIDIASQRSFKIQGTDSRIPGNKYKRSKIQIDNCQLFSDHFALQVQN